MKKIIGDKKEIARIAKAYAKAPDELSSISESERFQLRSIVNNMFGKISTVIHFDFVEKDPYKYNSIGPMRWDYDHGRMIKVNVSGNNSTLWGPVYNLMFRAVHDYVHAERNLDFNYKAEVHAYWDQLNATKDMKIISPHHPIGFLYELVLRSEIIYQAAYKTHYGKFHVPLQKIILQDL